MTARLASDGAQVDEAVPPPHDIVDRQAFALLTRPTPVVGGKESCPHTAHRSI